MADKPVNFVSWYDAARMSNWLTNGQGAGDTESGVYTFTGPDSISAITRDLSNPDQVFLPTEDEWYKAAFHQPAAQGGDGDDYWRFATMSDSDPTPAIAGPIGDIANPGANVANYRFNVNWNGLTGHVTSAGSAGSSSFYGAFDMNGNVWEWNESPFGSNRGFRGGSFASNALAMQASSINRENIPTNASFTFGFRLASPIPSPGAVTLCIIACPLLTRRRRD